MARDRRADTSLNVRPNATACASLHRLCLALESGADRLKDIAEIGTLFGQLSISGEYAEIVRSYISSVADDPVVKMPAIGKRSVVLFRNSSFSLVLQGICKKSKHVDGFDPTILATVPENGMISVISGGENLTLQKYEFDKPIDISIFDIDVRLRKIEGCSSLNHGKIVEYDAGNVMNIDVNKGVSYILKLSETAVLPFQWVIDKQSLAPMFPCATLAAVTRMETLVDLSLAFADDRLPREQAIALMKSLLRHPLHSVRWKALQGLSELDDGSTAHALECMSKDPHPHIRAAAQACLAAD
ncbi:hypothetical protein PQ455_03425 [Sphingomonas naphthae]|uniref:HEAT repeat domain-containing protein n=1 Tax=Sphingomonas naphthae TaxID=1813468 RepID=A0ABY7TNQ6_9SPHN|nr:hypothetical protein [Sphingomonas naphthae]WCT74292.1 hypothetical protein PQ455_03425 [Sphingomonas naphthae]